MFSKKRNIERKTIKTAPDNIDSPQNIMLSILLYFLALQRPNIVPNNVTMGNDDHNTLPKIFIFSESFQINSLIELYTNT